MSVLSHPCHAGRESSRLKLDLGAAAGFYNVDVNPARRFICAVLVAVAATAAGAQQTVPPPKPFPGATPPTGKPIEPPATPATPGAQSAPAPPSGPYGPAKSGCDAAAIGAPVYPGAQYVDSFDAGKGQRFCLFGTDAGYADIVEYYKRTMKGGNREIFRTFKNWFAFELRPMGPVAGTWRLVFELDGQLMIDAPFEVAASIDPAFNRAPEPITVAFEPARFG